MIDDLQGLLRSAVSDVFATMLNMPLQFDGAAPEAANGQPHIAGAVGFTGGINGVIYFYSSVKFARQMTSVLVGLPDHEIHGDEMINDAIGELTNMVGGRIKSHLCDRGETCVMTIPAVVRGSDFQVESISGARRLQLQMIAQGNPVRLELLLKISA